MKLSQRRFDMHSEWCPTDCSLNTDAADILEQLDCVTAQELESLAVNETMEFPGGTITRTS